MSRLAVFWREGERWACLSMMMTFLTQVHSRMMGTSLVISSGLHIRQRTCTSRRSHCR